MKQHQILIFVLLFCCVVSIKYTKDQTKLEGYLSLANVRIKREATILDNQVRTFFDKNIAVDPTSARSPNSSFPRLVSDGAPTSPQKIRLRGDGILNYNEGRVEVYNEETKSWGLVCDDYWELKDANITCRELGFYNAAWEATRNDRYGKGHWRDNDYTLQGVKCMGNEKSLLNCAHHKPASCSTKSAGVSCIFNRGCPEGWASFNGACYKVFTQPLSHSDAEKICRKEDSKLVYILAEKENNFISNMLYNTHKTITRAWTGGYYTEGTSDSGKKVSKWKWYSTIHSVADGKIKGLWFPGFYDWKSDSRPKGNPQLRSCIALNRVFQDSERDHQVFDVNYFWWDNLSCKETLPFICQKNKPKTKSDCYNKFGNDYRGRVSRTLQGSVCTKWSNPDVPVITDVNPNMGLGDHNFCRNPDNDIMPWCWVNPATGLYGYCSVGKCSEIPVETTEAVSPPLSVAGFGKGNCKESEFNCPSMVSYNRNCIAKELVCDRVSHCHDKEDENPAFCAKYLCKDNEFFCPKDMYCILNHYVCDGKRHCRDAADEKNCTLIDEKHVLVQFDKFDGQILDKKEKVSIFKLNEGRCMQICKIAYSTFGCRSFNFLPANATREYNECQLLKTVQSEEPKSLITTKYRAAHYSMKTNCTGQFTCVSGLCISNDQVCNGRNDCGDRSDEVNCTSIVYPPFGIRLTGSEHKWEGMVQVRYQGEWGFVCDDKFDLNAAEVVCCQLGLKGAVKAISAAVKMYGKVRRPNILLDEVTCNGTERSIEECSHSQWRKHNCQPDELAGVVCKFDRACTTDEFRCIEDKQCIDMSKVCDTIRDCSDGSDEPAGKCSIKVFLVNGTDKKSGRIEVMRAHNRGTVCDDGFDDNDAQVICRMIGIPGIAKAIKDHRFGPGTGQIALENLKCVGTEESLEKCPFYKWGGLTCSHKEDVGVICGATGLELSTTVKSIYTKAPDMTKEFQCGQKPINQKRSRLVGGFETIYGAFPWQVGVRMKVGEYDKHWCGATILSDDWIISAAHCYEKPKSEYRVRTGDWNNEADDKYEQIFELEELIIHPNWNRGNFDYDLTLLKVQRVKGVGIKFNDYVQPACLPKPGDQPDLKTKCVVSGWGDTLSDMPSVLLAAEVPLISRERCDDMYKDRLTDRMQCAGYEAGGIDTCQGDSGGPLVCKVKGLYTILGATSFGNGCAQPRSPGVYAKIEIMVDWVKQMTGL